MYSNFIVIPREVLGFSSMFFCTILRNILFIVFDIVMSRDIFFSYQPACASNYKPIVLTFLYFPIYNYFHKFDLYYLITQPPKKKCRDLGMRHIHQSKYLRTCDVTIYWK